MDPAKYVIIKGNYLTEEPIVIPCTANHADVVKEHTHVISAGMVSFSIEDGRMKAHCWGESSTLKQQGKPSESRGIEDAMIINAWILRSHQK